MRTKTSSTGEPRRRQWTRSSWSAWSGAVAMTSGVAIAADAPPIAPASVETLDRIQVTGSGGSAKVELSADPATFPGSTTTVTGADVAKLAVTSYGDLLRPLTGVNVDNFGNGGLGYGFSLRGFVDTEHGKDVAVFVDGVPINASSGVMANGYVDLNPLLPETVARFELLRGPIGTEYGNHALGGTVAFATATGAPTSRIDLSGGSWGTGRAFGLYGFGAGDVRGYGTVEAYRTDGYRDNGRDRRVDTFDKITFPWLSGEASLRVQLYDDSYGEPGYINRAAVEAGAIDARAAVNATDHGLHQQQNAVFNYAGRGDASWSSTAYVTHNALYRTRTSGGLALPGRGTSQRVDGDERPSFGGDLRRTSPIDGLGMPLLLVAGVSLYADRIDATRFGADLRGNRTVQTQDRDLTLYNPAAYAELQAKPLEIVRVTAGGRYDKFYDGIATGGRDSIPNLDIHATPGQFSPKGGVAIAVSPVVSLYGNVARGLKAPSAYDELVANPDLNVSKLRSVEAGVEGRDRDGRWRFVVDAWRTDQTGEVQNDPVTGALQNFGRTRRQGFDLEGRYRVWQTPGGEAAVLANFSRVSARIVGGGTGNDFVTTVPVYTATLGLDASVALQTAAATHRVGLFVYDSLVGAKHLDTAGQVDSRPYQRIAAKLTYNHSAWKSLVGYLTATVYPTSRLDETTFVSGGVVVTAPKAPVTALAGVTITLD